MAVSASKTQFVNNIQILANQLESARVLADEIATAYFKMGFNGGGSNPIVDADVTGNGLTAAKVSNLVTLAQQLGNFFGNAAVTQADYRATLDQTRTN
jgi:hypothetical protein